MELQQAKLRFHKHCFVCAACRKGLVGVAYKLADGERGGPQLPLCMDCW